MGTGSGNSVQLILVAVPPGSTRHICGGRASGKKAVTVNCNKNGLLLLRVKPASPCLMSISTTPTCCIYSIPVTWCVCFVHVLDTHHGLLTYYTACTFQPVLAVVTSPPPHHTHHKLRDELGSRSFYCCKMELFGRHIHEAMGANPPPRSSFSVVKGSRKHACCQLNRMHTL